MATTRSLTPSGRPSPLKNIVGGVVCVGALIAIPTLFDRLPSPAAASKATHSDEGTAHSANVQSFGNSHVEAQVLKGGALQLFFYGSREKQLMPVDTAAISAEAVTVGENSIPVSLTPKPYPGESMEECSRFVGTLPSTANGKTGLSLSITQGGSTYRVQWRPESLIPFASASDDASHTSMPVGLAANRTGEDPTPEEKTLFLTAGGKYTEADIATNGYQVAAIKYRGMMASHSMASQKGDRICPITNTLANKRFSWQIDGKSYQFCCPPCIEEFVRQAKETPEKIQSPDSYIKR